MIVSPGAGTVADGGSVPGTGSGPGVASLVHPAIRNVNATKERKIVLFIDMLSAFILVIKTLSFIKMFILSTEAIDSKQV
jgi:hypothetical protein